MPDQCERHGTDRWYGQPRQQGRRQRDGRAEPGDTLHEQPEEPGDERHLQSWIISEAAQSHADRVEGAGAELQFVDTKRREDDPQDGCRSEQRLDHRAASDHRRPELANGCRVRTDSCADDYGSRSQSCYAGASCAPAQPEHHGEHHRNGRAR